MTAAVTIPPDLIRPALELCLEFGLRPSAALLDAAGDLLLARAKEVQLDQLYENMKARFELKQAADAVGMSVEAFGRQPQWVRDMQLKHIKLRADREAAAKANGARHDPRHLTCALRRHPHGGHGRLAGAPKLPSRSHVMSTSIVTGTPWHHHGTRQIPRRRMIRFARKRSGIVTGVVHSQKGMDQRRTDVQAPLTGQVLWQGDGWSVTRVGFHSRVRDRQGIARGHRRHRDAGMAPRGNGLRIRLGRRLARILGSLPDGAEDPSPDAAGSVRPGVAGAHPRRGGQAGAEAREPVILLWCVVERVWSAWRCLRKS